MSGVQRAGKPKSVKSPVDSYKANREEVNNGSGGMIPAAGPEAVLRPTPALMGPIRGPAPAFAAPAIGAPGFTGALRSRIPVARPCHSMYRVVPTTAPVEARSTRHLTPSAPPIRHTSNTTAPPRLADSTSVLAHCHSRGISSTSMAEAVRPVQVVNLGPCIARLPASSGLRRDAPATGGPYQASMSTNTRATQASSSTSTFMAAPTRAPPAPPSASSSSTSSSTSPLPTSAASSTSTFMAAPTRAPPAPPSASSSSTSPSTSSLPTSAASSPTPDVATPEANAPASKATRRSRVREFFTKIFSALSSSADRPRVSTGLAVAVPVASAMAPAAPRAMNISRSPACVHQYHDL